MAMRFCPDCGTSHDCTAAAELPSAEVEIERLRTNRDIQVARITASAAKDMAETEAEADVARAEGEAEGMRDVLDAVTGGSEPTEPAPPVVLEPGPDAELEPEPGLAVEPPPVAEPTGEPPAAKATGWWDGYR